MKLLLPLFLFIGALFGGLYFVAFTEGGNAKLLPYINTYLSENVKEADIKVTHFRLKTSDIELRANVNDSIDIDARGPFNIFSKSFDLAYKIDADEIKSKDFSLKQAIHITGSAKGNLENINIIGKGEAFKAQLDYAAVVQENVPKNIVVNIDKAHIAELLAVAGMPAYAKGVLDLHVNMPEIDPENPKGDATLKVSHGVLNSAALKKDFDIDLPKNSTYKADFISKMMGEYVSIDGDIISSLANVNLNKGKYTLKNGNIDSNFIVSVKELRNLKSITNSALRGSFKLDGIFKMHDKVVSVSGNTKSFGGDTSFNFQGDTLNAKLASISTDVLLYKLGLPKYMNGKTSANVKLSSLANLAGTFDATSKGVTSRAIIKKEFGTDLGSHFDVNLKTDGTIKKGAVYTKANLQTTMANLEMKDIVYTIATGNLSSKYNVDIPDMGKLKPITGKAYRGNMAINGNIKKAKDLRVDGHGQEFGGSIDFNLVNDNFNADVKGATVSKVLYMMGYPQVIEAVSQAKVKYNLATSMGEVDAKLDGAKILPNQLTTLIKQFTKFDIAKELYNNTTFAGKIAKDMMKFDFKAASKSSHFNIHQGKLNKRTGQIDATVKVKIKGKEYSAKISGNVNKPRVKLDMQGLLKDKAMNKVNKFLEKKGLNTKAKDLLKNKLGIEGGDKILGNALKNLF